MKGQRLTLLRIYLDDSEREDHHNVGITILNAAFEEKLAGATVFRSEMGIGRSHRVRQVRNEWDLDHLPFVIQIADTDAKIDVFCDAHAQLLKGHLATRETIWFVHAAGGQDLPHPVEDLPDNVRPKLVRMFCNKDDVTYNGPGAVEAVTGAVATHSIFHMAMTGIEGFGSHRVLHRGRLFHHDNSMPVMVSAMCEADKLDILVGAAVEAFPGLTITVESVTHVPLPAGGQE
jgi:PII-like signaling protein